MSQPRFKRDTDNKHMHEDLRRFLPWTQNLFVLFPETFRCYLCFMAISIVQENSLFNTKLLLVS